MGRVQVLFLGSVANYVIRRAHCPVSQLEINELDIADGLKELLYEKKYDLNSLLQSHATSLADELGIEEYVAKIIINAAKKKATE